MGGDVRRLAVQRTHGSAPTVKIVVQRVEVAGGVVLGVPVEIKFELLTWAQNLHVRDIRPRQGIRRVATSSGRSTLPYTDTAGAPMWCQ